VTNTCAHLTATASVVMTTAQTDGIISDEMASAITVESQSEMNQLSRQLGQLDDSENSNVIFTQSDPVS